MKTISDSQDLESFNLIMRNHKIKLLTGKKKVNKNIGEYSFMC